MREALSHAAARPGFLPDDFQEELYQRAYEFARERLGGKTPSDAEWSRSDWTVCGEFGLLGLCLPETLGGLGLGAVTTARVCEAFGRGCRDFGMVFSALAHLFACAHPVARFAGPVLARRIVPDLARGRLVGANAITEAEAGSDVFALTTTAVRDGGGYRLTGIKSFVTNAPVADLFVVYAKTNPELGEFGVSAFVVERDRAGLTVGQPFDKMGLGSAPVSQLYLNDCYIPAENLLGREGQGAEIFGDSMAWERSCLFAAYVGLMERQLEQTLAYARDRRQFRKAIGKRQAIAHRIADMKLRLESARLLLYRACWMRDQGQDATLEISMAKLAISEAAVQSSLDMMQIHGGLGYMTESGIPAELASVLPARIFSGTSEIQRDLIAARLGL